jgi:LysR family transcriptional regulator, low CO2-responsive transcriptional regulator
MSFTLTQLRAFQAVSRSGSIHAAADQLMVTQPSVSAAVAGLARELGVQLVERDGRGIRLTPAGEAFSPYVDQVLGLLEQGRRSAFEATRPDTARIRVISVNTAGEYLLPALIQAYRSTRPATEILLEIANRREVIRRLEAREADIGIGGRPLGPRVSGKPFIENELVVVGREHHDDLEAATWLLREEGSGTRAALEAYLDEQGIRPREQLTLGSNGAVKQALFLGLGVTLISLYAVSRELRDGSLVRIPAPGTPLHRAFHVLRLRQPPPRPAVNELIEFLHAPAARTAITAALAG